MDDLELLAKIEHEETLAYGINDAQLSFERAQSIRYYLGEPFGNEVEGRSQVVSYDVQDTVESSLPQLIKIFTAGDQVVRFDPRGPEDEDKAAQETDYINHVVMEKNNGFEMMYVWFKDALISKNGYVKAYFEENYETETESYQGITDEQLQLLVQDESVEVVEHSTYPDSQAEAQIAAQMEQMTMQWQQQAMQSQMAGQQPPEQPQPPQIPNLNDVKIKITEKKGCVKVKNVAPENIKVSVDTVGMRLNDSRFVQHCEPMSISEVERQFNVKDSELGFSSAEIYGQESNARDRYSEQFDRTNDEDVLVKDTYYMVDGKRWRFVVIGNTIVHREETDCVPFACVSPMLMPHRHIGRSYSDLTMDIQLIKSALIRGQLDNMYLSLNGRYAISDRVNLEDMLTSRPGGVVRVQGEPSTAILPLSHVPLPQSSFSMVEYLDSMKEKRTGVTAYNQGLDADSLNKTATGINAIMQAAAARLELVARVFAETGVKDLFMLVHRLVRMNYTKPDIVKLRGKWVNVDPREWKNRYDMSIAVGLGTGNKDAQLMHIQTILAAQKEFMGMGVATPQNAYNALVKLTQNAGFRNPEMFWTDPQGKAMPPPPPDPKIQVAQIQAQADEKKQQMELQADAQKFQAQTITDQQRAEQEAQLAQQTAERQQQNEMMRSQNDLTIEREKLQLQAQLERYKADLKAETDLKIAAIRAQYQQQRQFQGANA